MCVTWTDFHKVKNLLNLESEIFWCVLITFVTLYYQDLLGCTIARMGTIQSTISRGTSKGKPTVSDAFRNQLQALVDVLQATNPWCVVF